jgi:hypothetical protein
MGSFRSVNLLYLRQLYDEWLRLVKVHFACWDLGTWFSPPVPIVARGLTEAALGEDGKG